MAVLALAHRPLPIIAKVVGWELSTVVAMAQRYGHFPEEDMRSAVEAISTPPTVPCEVRCGSEAKPTIVQ